MGLPILHPVHHSITTDIERELFRPLSQLPRLIIDSHRGPMISDSLARVARDTVLNGAADCC